MEENVDYDNDKPLVSVAILKTKRSSIVRNLHIENVLPVLEPFLLYTQVNNIKAETNQGCRTGLLLDYIHQRAVAKSYRTFNAFLRILGGTQPEIFTELVGRPPTELEADFCLEGFVKLLKKDIKDKGYKPDSLLDEPIDLESEHVQLQIIKRKDDKVHFAKTDTEQLYFSHQDKYLPHQYQQHLSELEKNEKNIAASDILNTGGKHAQTVLLSGRAGVGKTTTLQWLARQWALDRWASGFTVLFLLQLRLLSLPDSVMTTTEFLSLFCLFQVEHDYDVLCSWLKNASSKLIILIDGLDEISAFARKIQNTPKITDLSKKAHPVDLCINILRGDLLPGCTVICTSRPFTGLSYLTSDIKLEILGLNKKQVKVFVENRHPKKAPHIMSELNRNPILMSVCGITFYCMAVSSLLNQGVTFMDDDFQTYSRLMTFIMVQHLSRKLSEWPFVIEVSPYLGKLAHLAYKGIFQPAEQGISKVTFNEYDLAEVRLTPSKLRKLREIGILQIKEIRLTQGKSLSAEFLHLTIQELLAVAFFLSHPLSPKDLQILYQGQSNMVLMYLFGLRFDNNSKWIKDVCKAVSPSGFCTDSGIDLNISEFLRNTAVEDKEKLWVCQLVHEGHVDYLAKAVVDKIAPNGKLEICYEPMTGIDLMAVVFVCQFSQALTEICLTCVNADDTFVEILSSSLMKLHNNFLKSFEFRNNRMSAEGAETLAKAVQKCQCLERLDVSFNYMGNEGLKAIVEATCGNKTLIELDVTGNHITQEGAPQLGKILKVNQNLQTLLLFSNNLGDCGAIELAEGLKSNVGLTRLGVEKTNIGPPGAAALAEALCTNQSLQYLDISDNYIGVEGSKAFAEALTINGNLKSLRMTTNDIWPEGTMALSEALQSNVYLVELDISMNHAGDKSAKALAAALSSNQSLKKLKLVKNNIAVQGAMVLAEALGDNVGLEYLDVSGNNIGDEGARAMAEALSTNQSLLTLSLIQNDITGEGAVALSKALYTNVYLWDLNVSFNNIGDEGAKALAEALCFNKSIKKMGIYNNDISDKGAGTIAKVLRTNEHIDTLQASLDDVGPYWNDLKVLSKPTNAKVKI